MWLLSESLGTLIINIGHSLSNIQCLWRSGFRDSLKWQTQISYSNKIYV